MAATPYWLILKSSEPV
ncbi:hypothetical protein ECE32_03575 [Acinetobacter baumannii]|nr:hypothetical protein [Acinetobacter baumannii]